MSAFALRTQVGIARLSQVLQINGRLCHLVLAFPYVGDIANGRAPSLRGHYSASSLLRTQPPPSRLWPTSRFRRLYGLPCSDDFAPGRGGFQQVCLSEQHEHLWWWLAGWRDREVIPHGRQDLAVMMVVQPSDNFVDNIVCAVSVDFLSVCPKSS